MAAGDPEPAPGAGRARRGGVPGGRALPVPADAVHRPEHWPTGRLLATASRLVEHAWGEVLESIGLTFAGLIVLHLLDLGPTSQTELARHARVEAQTMSRTLERLERAGWIVREPDPADRRRHIVTKTPAGVEVFEKAQRLEADLFPSVGDMAAFRRALLEIVTDFETRRWPAATGHAAGGMSAL